MPATITDHLPRGAELVLDERFDGPHLDPDLWLPYHLPHWSSRTDAAARHRLVDGGGLELRVDPDQQPWCPAVDGDTRVSSVQTGVRSGPVGSTDGQHRFAEGLVVREAQPTRWLFTPTYGVVALRASADLDDDSMAALWMVGIEDRPEHCAVIDVMEVFGRDASADATGVGMSVKAFDDPRLRDDVGKVDLPIDVGDEHEYAVVWTPDGVTWFVDGEQVRRSDHAPAHPLQLMLGVYAFAAPTSPHVPRFHVASVRAWSLP